MTTRYSKAELDELQKKPEPWWPEPESVWKSETMGRVQVVGVSVDRQVAERVITYRDDKQWLWTQTLRSFLGDFKVSN